MTRELINQILSADGDTIEATVNETGEYAYAAVGTFGSGTLTPYVTPKNQGTAVALTSLAYTANAISDTILLSQGDKFKATLAGSTSPSIKVTLTWVR